jgi:hypothetical protein
VYKGTLLSSGSSKELTNNEKFFSRLSSKMESFCELKTFRPRDKELAPTQVCSSFILHGPCLVLSFRSEMSLNLTSVAEGVDYRKAGLRSRLLQRTGSDAIWEPVESSVPQPASVSRCRSPHSSSLYVRLLFCKWRLIPSFFVYFRY